MPAAARLGDNAQIQQDAHGCPSCPHPGTGPITAASPDVFVNKRPAGRVDDLGLHAVCCGPNIFQVAKGSPDVYVNGKPFARNGDKTTHCGGNGKIIEGSPDVMVNDGASAANLADYIINALKILLEQALEHKQEADQPGSGSNSGATKPSSTQGQTNNQTPPAGHGSISRVGWSIQRALNGQDVELQVECQNPKGSLKIEIWSVSADRTQDKSVQKIDASAAKSVKKKVKLEIPPDAAGQNESHFYFVVKDDNGGEMKSEPLFVDRAPFRFSK
ncbi:MAG: PAAR domain-containing protein [Deltaproteobacteria bacterium]|nr:PAAR domain-containing protein [Deltaproteobacteria bacterium]